MTEEPNKTLPNEFIDQSEKLRSQIEFERSNHVAKGAAFVEPNLSRSQAWDDAAINFATFGVKLLTTLNGGAILFASPAFTFLEVTPTKTEFAILILFFTVGLLAGFLSLIGGFFACARRSETYSSIGSKNAIQANMQYSTSYKAYIKSTLNKDVEIPTYQDPRHVIEEKDSAFNFWRALGIVMIFGSVSCFAAGLAWSAWIMS